MRIIFFGTPYYVLPILEGLHKSFKERGESPIEAVVTQSPKPTGRKQLLEYSAVDKWAHSKKIPIYFDAKELISRRVNADVGILASYGEKIPFSVINYFKYGILVIHPSLLPEFRWGSPVPAALVTGTNPTGVTIIKMDEKWDHGPIVTQVKEEILEEDNYQTLRDRLFAKSAEVLVQALPAYVSGKIKLKAQDDTKASFARMIKKEDAFIPPEMLWSVVSGQWPVKKNKLSIDFIKDSKNKNYLLVPSAYSLDLFIRAMTPWPGAWTEIRLQGNKVTESRRLKILNTHVESLSTEHGPRNTILILDSVQLEGKNPVSWEEFKRGYPQANF